MPARTTPPIAWMGKLSSTSGYLAMIVNRDSRPWVIVCVAIFIAATAAYYFYARNGVGGANGGSAWGLAYGVGGTLLMLAALLLGARKRVRTLRIGRAYHWMQAHVWLGLLSYPLILMHGGFRWGGPLTSVMMWVFTIVVFSGIVGLILQQFIPSKLLNDAPAETIYEQIDRVIDQLRQEAAGIVDSAEAAEEGRAFDLEVVPAGQATATAPAAQSRSAQALRDFYGRQIEPFLQRKFPAGHPLANEISARAVFQQLKDSASPSLAEPIEDLRQIADERRQLARQKQLHHLLHAWLFVHVPLSYALIILVAYHAVEALRFVQG
jgi:hypothetical protein